MGGCRCSYRDCRVKSDGKTHLFHYPVFERARCQKWLKNANKFDLLELTLGQLKNRVVCQHHFKDSMFMNAKKNKLKFEAVPTENGPYCKGKSSHNSEINFEPESYIPCESGNLLIDDKKTHYYQKYSDFLTKNNTSNNVTLENEDKNKLLEITIMGLDSTNLGENYIVPELVNSTSNKQIGDPSEQIATTTEEEKRTITVEKILPVTFENISNTEHITSKSPNKVQNVPRRSKKIKILENKEVDFKFLTDTDINLSKSINYLQVMGDVKLLRPVTDFQITDAKPLQPITDLQISDVNQSQYVTDLQITDVKPSQSGTNLQITDVKPLQSGTDLQITDVKPLQSGTDLQITDVKPLQSVTDLQMTGDVKQIVTNSHVTEHDKPIKRITRAIKSAQQLVNNGNIELRLQQLENKLMSALNRNTQELVEVRKLVDKNGNTNKPTRSCRSFGTQTKLSEEQEKRYHYNQLSRFLSNETKSVLYEALFLSKYDIETNTPKPKRRKCIL